MLKISETYFVGIDVSEDDQVALSVIRRTGKSTPMWEHVNTIIGEDAQLIFEDLTNIKLEGMSTLSHKKPVVIHNFGKVCCSACNSYLCGTGQIESRKTNYCPNCGQGLDWLVLTK